MSSAEATALPGDGWRFEVLMATGEVYDTPVVGWVVTPSGGMCPALVVPGDTTAVSVMNLDATVQRRRGIDDIRLYHRGVSVSSRAGSENSVMGPR